MDEKLLRRVQAIGAILIGVAYFLPWASIMSPLGSVELRGLYVDYAWILLILAILHLLLQFARLNRDALGLPDSSLRYMEVIWRAIPFVFVAFFAWYGASFGFNAHNASFGRHATFFGTSVDSIVKAGLDYGYWIGACGAVLLIAGIGLASKQAQMFVGYAALVAVATVGLAFGFSRPGKQVGQTAIRASSEGPGTPSGASADAPAPTNSTGTDFDSSSYVQLASISARRLAKDYEASRYRNSVVISPVFKNVGSNTIVGLRGYLSVIDGFGKEVYGFTFRDDDKILPGHDSGRGGYSFEENQFEDDDPYHKMVPLIDAGTAKYAARITRIAFEDGTVLPKK
jgi:hypothetical protein